MAGSVYARKINSTGRSNRRVTKISCRPSTALTCVFWFLFIALWFVRFHNVFQFVEAVIPHLPEWFQEFSDFLHFMRVEVVVNFSSSWFFVYEFAFGQDLNVSGNGRPGGVKIGCDGSGCQRLGSQQQKYRSPGGVCDGLKGVSS